MTIPKKQILDIVNNFPEEIEIEEIIYRLYLKEKLELAEKDIMNGDIISHDDLVQETKTWFQK